MIKIILFRFYQIPFFICFFAFAVCSEGQNSEPDSTALDSLSFPMTWAGHWAGELFIYKGSGLLQKVEMELEISPMDTSDNFVWAIIYGPDKIKGRRSYELATIDAKSGKYLIDEKNTIQLESYLFQNKLYSRFEVMGNWLLCSYEKIGEQILFEIISGKNEAISNTGGQKFEGEDIPEVKAFPIVIHQQAKLSRKELVEKK